MWHPLLALAAVAQPAPLSPDLAWLTGYWLSCEGAAEVSESWSDARAGTMVGTTLTVTGGRLSYEFARIAPSASGVSFFAQPGGRPPTEFALKESGVQRVVFENPAHDFPQRVIYARDGKGLTARIEGMMDGKPAAMAWRYAAAKLNGRCSD